MKKYRKELVITAIQAVMFYLFPLTAGPTDMMGLVVVLLFSSFLLSLLLGALSRTPFKYAFPSTTMPLPFPTPSGTWRTDIWGLDWGVFSGLSMKSGGIKEAWSQLCHSPF